MDERGKGLAGRSKRQLVALLAEEVQRWDGIMPLGRSGERSIRTLMDMLERCTLFTHERHWLAMCEIWIGEARRKAPRELQKIWLQALHDWIVYLEEHPQFADDPPVPR